MKISKNKLLLLAITLVTVLILVSAVNATDDTDKSIDNTISEKTSTTTSNVIKETTTKESVTKTQKTINKENKTEKQTKKESQTITLNNENYNEYVTNTYFNEKVNSGDTIDIQGTIEKPAALNVNKKLNFITSTHDGVLTGANGFNLNHAASGSSVEGIVFKNVQFIVNNASDIKINNISTLNEHKSIGAGVGSFSVREGSNNITITNSYFKCQDNTGHSNVVFGKAYNCLFENNTVESGFGGMVGNIFYLTTYNVGHHEIDTSVNITIRNNHFRAVDILPAQAITVLMVIEGYGHVIENNVLDRSINHEADNDYVFMSQYADSDYGMSTEIGQIIFRNNTVLRGTVKLGFNGQVYDNNLTNASAKINKARAYNNTFKNVEIEDDVKFEENNIVLDKIKISGKNNDIKNLGEIKELVISGNENNVTNLTVIGNSPLNITGSTNSLTNSTIKTEGTFAIIVTGKHNNITNNYVTSNILNGDSAIKGSKIDNIIENNYPEGNPSYEITDETYNDYFDENGTEKSITNNSVVTLTGTFNNKDFIFNKLHGIIVSNKFVLNNGTLNITDNAQLSFDGSFTINNRKSDKNVTLIVESNNNEFRNRITLYDDHTKTGTNVIVSGNNNILIFTAQNYRDKTEFNTSNRTGIIIDGENNYITGSWTENNAQANVVSVLFTPESKNNTYTGNPYTMFGGSPNSLTTILLSGEGNILKDVTQSSNQNTGISVLVDNASNAIITGGRFTSSDKTIIINNSNNILIENVGTIQNNKDKYPIQLYNSSHNTIRNNQIINNETYGGNNAVFTDENSYDNTITNNAKTYITLNDETYSELFTNNVYTYDADVIVADGDLHDKTLIFTEPIIIEMNNHSLYNSEIITNHTTGTTTINNPKMNLTNIPTAITINGTTIINNLELYQDNNAINTKTIIVNYNTLTLNTANVNINTSVLNEDSIAILVEGDSTLKANNLNLNFTTTKIGEGRVVAIKSSNNISTLNNININIESDSDVTGIYGVYEQQNTQKLNITGINVIGLEITNPYAYSINPQQTTINAPQITINAAKNATGISINNEEYIEDNRNVKNPIITINSETAVGIHNQNSRTNYQSAKITINAANIVGFELENYQRDLNGHTLTLTGETVTGIKLTNTNTTNTINNNNIYINNTEGYAIQLENTSQKTVNNNILNTNITGKQIIVINSSNIKIQNNEIPNEEYPGNLAIETENSENITILNNKPILKLILTEDNYNTYFTDGEYNSLLYDEIELGSNLNNKDLIFDRAVSFNGNNYALNDGTIILKNTASTTTIQQITINNTNSKKAALSSEATVTFTKNKIYNATIIIENTTSQSRITNNFINNKEIQSIKVYNALVTISNNEIYQEANNTKVISMEQNSGDSYFNDNNITSIGNNNDILYYENYRYSNNRFYNNKITSTGDDNILLHVLNTSSNSIMIRSTFISNTNKASTPILIEASRVSFIYNSVLVNTTQGNIPIVNSTGHTSSMTLNNYLESLDLAGNDAVYTEGRNQGNTPTTGNHNVTINIENKTLIAYEENTINVNVTDLFENILTETITATINGEEVTITNNMITYTPSQPGDVTLTVSYTDPNGKYQSKTATTVFNVPIPTSKVEPTTEELKLGDNTTLTAAFYTEDGIPITEGKAIFRVNGKTLRDNEGNVIYVDIVDGKAVLPDVNITSEWMKPDTTIQAVYIGDNNNDPITTTPTTVTVTKPEATIILDAPTEATAGTTITLKATVTDGDKQVTSGRVAFKLNGKTLKNAEGKALYAEVRDGVATITYTIPEKTKAKEYTLTAVFTDTNYDRVEAESKLNVVKA